MEKKMILDSFGLKGKTAIVTGSSSGIGEAICEALAQAGANVAGVARRPSIAAKQKVEKCKGRFLEIQADLSNLDSIDLIMKKVLDEFGRVDILVNNAGIIRRMEALDFTKTDWDDVMNLNLKSIFFLSQAVARQFVKQGHGGKIINIASLLSFQGGIRVVSYTSSKSALSGMTKALANEWSKHNINVNAIAPGYIETDNTEPLRTDPIRNKSILERIPAGRWGLPEDLGGTAVFLASDASHYVNGHILAVDGGWLAR